MTVNGDVVLKRPMEANPFAESGKASAKPVALLNDVGATATMQDVTIEAGASIENKKDAVLNAGTVTVKAGSLLWNYTGGKLNFDNLIVQGSIRDYGTLSVADTLSVASGGSYSYDGKTKVGNALSVENGGTLSMSGETSLKRLVVGSRAASSFAANSESVSDSEAEVEVVEGEHFTDTLELNSGTVNVRKGATLAGVDIDNNLIGSKVTVDAGGTFAFSYTKSGLEAAMEAYKGDKTGWDEKAKLALSDDLHFGDGGSITIGTTDAASTVNLGSDALVLLGTTQLHGQSLLNGEGVETLSVEKGAEIALPDALVWGNHYLVKGFDETAEEELKGLTVHDRDGEALEIHVNEKGAYVTVGSDSIADKDESFGLQGNIDSVLDGMQDVESGNADVRVLTKLVMSESGAESSSQLQSILSESGVMSENVRMAQQTFDTVLDHAETVRSEKGTLWAKGLYSKSDVSGLASGTRDVDYESDVAGFAMGADWKEQAVLLGINHVAPKEK